MMPRNEESHRGRGRRIYGSAWFARGLLFLAIGGLLIFALHRVSIPAIWRVLQVLRPWQILLVLAMDGLVYLFMSARWWLIVHAEDIQAPFTPMIAVRLAAFGVSYFTLGPQVGGEPLQVLYLRRVLGSTFPRATAGVVLDKLLELLANFVFLMLGIWALISAGVLHAGGSVSGASLAAVFVVGTWPIFHIALLRSGHYPVSSALGAAPWIPPNGRLARYVRASERLAGKFCQRHAPVLAAAIAASLMACASAVIEYALITSFLGVRLQYWQTIAAWTAGWLSFLVPLPGGLGALEASQVLALGLFGVPPAVALAVTTVIRARDVLFGGLGLAFAALLAYLFKSNEPAVNVLSRIASSSAGHRESPGGTASGNEDHG
jgi:uncharacterized protein (TIRG00374 family)